MQFVGTYLAGFPDWRIVVDDQIAEGVTYSKISDGQVHESWASWDTLSMLRSSARCPSLPQPRTEQGLRMRAVAAAALSAGGITRVR